MAVIMITTTSIMSTIGMMLFISNAIPEATTFPTTTTTTEDAVDTIAPLPSIITSTTEKPSDDAIQSCPIGMFQCWLLNKTAKKSNHLFDDYPEFPELTIPSFICIDQSRLCDGHRDCPFGQDESDDMCHQDKPDDNHTAAGGGCYLCRNSTEICIEMSKLCDNRRDCPEGDDESLCKHSIHPILASTYESKFSANQYGPTNINIVNRDSGNLEKNPILPPNNSENVGMKPPLRDGNDRQQPPSVQDGVGFQFRVNNLVIYNSVVKIFG
ncbi:hypothetical protein BLA29_007802 [Euroglyphus maynei]|uniref:Uncharacterized protein n=1 Tax=Euroglyphus maynei TaxID=6958 RepID=A0A1Y3BEE0_EURMA|nr:hypothetical protein BLA29_007802 [Euroglyphus maynei]